LDRKIRIKLKSAQPSLESHSQFHINGSHHAPAEPLVEDEYEYGDGDGYHTKLEGHDVAAGGTDIFINSEGYCLGNGGDIACNDYGGAELTEPAGEHKGGTCYKAPCGMRYDHSQNCVNHPAPRVRDASISRSSIVSIPVRMDLTMRGKPTTAVAITATFHVKIRRMPRG
jgi:hypothetical protein